MEKLDNHIFNKELKKDDKIININNHEFQNFEYDASEVNHLNYIYQNYELKEENDVNYILTKPNKVNISNSRFQEINKIKNNKLEEIQRSRILSRPKFYKYQASEIKINWRDYSNKLKPDLPYEINTKCCIPFMRKKDLKVLILRETMDKEYNNRRKSAKPELHQDAILCETKAILRNVLSQINLYQESLVTEWVWANWDNTINGKFTYQNSEKLEFRQWLELILNDSLQKIKDLKNSKSSWNDFTKTMKTRAQDMYSVPEEKIRNITESIDLCKLQLSNQNPVEGVYEFMVISHCISYAVNKHYENQLKTKHNLRTISASMLYKSNKKRVINKYSFDENHQMVALVRSARVPLSGGISGTTLDIINLYKRLGIIEEYPRDMFNYLVMFLFSAFNVMPTMFSPSHTLYEVIYGGLMGLENNQNTIENINKKLNSIHGQVMSIYKTCMSLAGAEYRIPQSGDLTDPIGYIDNHSIGGGKLRILKDLLKTDLNDVPNKFINIEMQMYLNKIWDEINEQKDYESLQKYVNDLDKTSIIAKKLVKSKNISENTIASGIDYVIDLMHKKNEFIVTELEKN